MYTILLIEDDKEIIDTLSELLKLEDYNVITAPDGRKGIASAIRNVPDLIICDIMMPEIDGYEVLKTLRQQPSTFSIPFLFLTAKVEKTDQRQGMTLGADDYIMKPYEEEDILNAIESRLKKNREIKKFYNKKMEELHNYIAATLPRELRIPLNTIIGFTSILKNKYQDLNEHDINSMHDNILNAGKRLLHLISDYTYYTTLIDVSASVDKYPEGHTEHSQTIIYNKIIEKAKEYNRVGKLKINLTDTALDIVDSHLAKISEELIDNAFKYSEPDSEVFFDSYPEAGSLILSVKNTGKGMTEEQIKKIGPFIQFMPELKSRQSSGLGLAIVKKITDIYKGSFKIESSPGEVTVVIVEIPLKKKEITYSD